MADVGGGWLLCRKGDLIRLAGLFPAHQPSSHKNEKAKMASMRSIRCILYNLIVIRHYFINAFYWGNFSIQPDRRKTSTLRNFFLLSTASETDINTRVARISVCTGELCQCQGDYEDTGGAADDALQKLRSLVTFPVDEVGCMGACGMGIMIAIDYENGDSIMTDGPDGVISELGLKGLQSSAEPTLPLEKTITNERFTADKIIKDSLEGAAKKSRKLADVRERMREEVAKEDQQENPWMNMASYLAEKAAEKVLGKKQN